MASATPSCTVNYFLILEYRARSTPRALLPSHRNVASGLTVVLVKYVIYFSHDEYDQGRTQKFLREREIFISGDWRRMNAVLKIVRDETVLTC